MNVRFSNRYKRNRELAKELYLYWYFKRPMIVAIDIALTVGLVGNSLLNARNPMPWIFALVFIFVLQFVLYKQSVNTMLRRDAEIGEGEREIESIVTDDGIEVIAQNGNRTAIQYEKIKTATQTKNLILLITKARLIVIFKKDCFETGTAEELVEFLKTKGIEVSGKR